MTFVSLRELVIMEAACQLGLLQMGGDMLVRHFMHSGLDEIGFLELIFIRIEVQWARFKLLTSSVDQARPPPVDEDFRLR